MNVIALATDTEYTSFDRVGGDLLAKAFVEILENYTLGREAVFYAKPRSSKYFTEEAVVIHGISYFRAVGLPDPAMSCLKALTWLPKRPIPLVYHGNGDSDRKWLLAHYDKCNLRSHIEKIFPEEGISTLKLARENIKHIQEPKLKNRKGELITKYSLPNIAQHYNLKLKHHDPLSDARVCAQIYCNIMKGEGVWDGKIL